MLLSKGFLIIFCILISIKCNEPFLNENNINYLEFEFRRNLSFNETSEPNIVIKNLFYNQIYINMRIGSSKQEIPFYIHLHQYPSVIESANISSDQVKGLFNESLSETYKIIKNYDYFAGGDMTKGVLSSDNFYVNNNNISNFTFYVSKENKLYTHITEGGKIGFELYPPHYENEDSSFIKNLKKNNLIFSYIFLLKYNSNKDNNDDSGKLIIGAYPHLYDKTHYKEEYYIRDKAEKGYREIDWIFSFDEIKIGEEIIETNNKEIYFYYEFGLIIGSKYYFNYLKNQESFKYYFENSTKCNKSKININDLEDKENQQKLRGDFFSYYCDKDVDVKKINISKISFVKKNMNYTFYLDENDFWIEKGNYKYFAILERDLYSSTYWCLGKPFFKKYDMIFEYDNEHIGLYTTIFDDKGEEKESILVYILVIVGLGIIICFLAFWLIKCYLNLPRKKRANELLDDNYEYKRSKEGETVNNN